MQEKVSGKIYAAIVAGGTGSRMGADIPKQFLMLCGKPIIIRTTEAFLQNRRIDKVYIGVHPDWTDRLLDMLRQYGIFSEKIAVTQGGSDRNATVFKIIELIEKENGIAEGDIILTHDGVRPFVTQKIIDESIRAMYDYDGVTAAVLSTDTVLYSVDGKKVTDVPSRSKVFRMQTPQTFRLKKLIEAYSLLNDGQKASLTDTASIFTAAGLDVGLIKGININIKITEPFDMVIGEAIINNRI